MLGSGAVTRIRDCQTPRVRPWEGRVHLSGMRLLAWDVRARAGEKGSVRRAWSWYEHASRKWELSESRRVESEDSESPVTEVLPGL